MSHVSAALRRAGHEVAMLDLERDEDRLEERASAFAPDIVGVSVRNIDDVDSGKRTYFVPDLVDAVKRLRAITRAPVVLGGSAFSLFPEELLGLTGADYGIRGEGEDAMPELVAALGAGQPCDHVGGIVYRRDGRVVIGATKACDMHTVPLPWRPGALTEYYAKHSTMLNVQTQRGCAFGCIYCTYPLIEGAHPRFREPGAVADDMEAAVRAGARYLFVVDSVFNTDRDHVAGICEEIIRRRLEVRWCCFLRPAGLDAEIMGLLARSGLTHIEFGSDSFCDPVLDAYGKMLTFDDILQSSNLALAHKIRYAHFAILGGPAETEETIRCGIANSRRLRRTVIFSFVGMRVYPGTRLHARALADNAIAPSRNLLEPFHYVAPGLETARIHDLLRSASGTNGNWVLGELPAELAAIADKLRAKGVAGPLWELLAR